MSELLCVALMIATMFGGSLYILNSKLGHALPTTVDVAEAASRAIARIETGFGTVCVYCAQCCPRQPLYLPLTLPLFY